MTVKRVVKPKNQRSKRALEEREPKAIEVVKETLLIKGQKCSETVQKALKGKLIDDLNLIQKN